MKLETDEVEVKVVEHPNGRLDVCVQVSPQDYLTIVSLKEGEPLRVGSKGLGEENCGIPTDSQGRPHVVGHDGNVFYAEDYLSDNL